MKKISNLLMMALLTIGMGLTSCDEQLDNAVNPGVGEVTSIEVDLSKIDAKNLDTEKTKLVLTEGDVVTLSFTILPEEMADTEVELTVDDATILSIEGLKVTALKAGETKVTAKAGEKEAYLDVMVKELVNLSAITEDYTAQDGTVLTGTLASEVKISIADGATVTLKDVTITNLGVGCDWAGINCPDDATLVLEGTNTVCAGRASDGYNNYPGIYIAPDKTLTIQGDGTLTAYSNGTSPWGAGIGGGFNIPCGNIVINGGNITANGGNKAAGIGCGNNASCGNIEISGGTITATGGQYAAGIGGGNNNGECGTITITSGVTSVKATKGTDAPCSIGKGDGGQDITVTIGETVHATGISQSPYEYPLPALSLTNPAVGQVIGSDGKNYAANATLPDGVTKVAMIAYVSGSNGLAIALADESSGMKWAAAKTTCEAKTPAFTGGTWKLPTQDEWKQMFKANGDDNTKYTGLNNALAAAGGDELKDYYKIYWSSTTCGENQAYYVYVKPNGSAEWYSADVDNSIFLVRAVLEF